MSRLREDLYTIWNWIGEKPVVADLSPQMLRQVSDRDLVEAFSRMPKFAYYRAVESLFIMYPLAPVSVLTVRQQNAWRFEEGGSRVSAGIYGGWLSCICGTLMEQLANNYSEQAFKIACLPQIYGDGIALSAGQFCNVLCQKALCVLTARES